MPHARHGNIELYYEEMGPATGEPLLLIMGMAFSAQLIWWPEGLCQMFADRGFRVVRFDNRAVGLSSPLEHLDPPDIADGFARWTLGLPLDPPYSLGDMADDAAAVLDAVGLRSAHVCGASIGGVIAQHLAISYPHRVRSLTCMMSWSGSRWEAIPSPDAMRAILQPPAQSRERAAEQYVHLFGVLSGEGFPFDEDHARDLGARCFDRSRGSCENHRQALAVLASESLKSDLLRLRVPSLVIHGARDPLVPWTGGEALAKALPHARFLLFDDMGHNLPQHLWHAYVDAIAEVAGLR